MHNTTRSASLWPTTTDGNGRAAPHALLTSGGLHLSAYLLRLLDHHRPTDPLAYLQNVLRRGNGGMVLAAPMLLEFLTQATNAPTASLMETLRFSLMGGAVRDARDALWREVTFAAARAMGAIAAKQRTSSSAAADSTAADGVAAPKQVFESTGVIAADSMLPTFETLYRRGAPWQMLFAHNIVTSRILMGRLVAPASSSSSSSTAGSSGWTRGGKPLTALHIVVELDGEDPASHVAFLRRADAAEGGELLQLIVEEIGGLLPPEGVAASSFFCTLEIVLVSTTAALHNLQSATHHLFRLVSALVAAYQPTFGRKTEEDRDAGGETEMHMPPKPAWLKMIRLHLANRTTYAFPVLQALLSAQHAAGGGGGGGGGPSIDLNGPHAACMVWLRDTRRHTELLLQLGHALHAFMDVPSGGGPMAAWLDAGGSLMLDAHTSSSVAVGKSKSTGITVVRSFLRHPRVLRQELLHALVLRQLLQLSCGRDGASRALPATTPLLLLRVGSETAALLGRLAIAERANAPNLAESPHDAVLVARFAAYAASLYLDRSTAASRAVQQCPLIGTVGSGMMAFAAPSAAPAEELLAALREAAYVREQVLPQHEQLAAADGTTTTSELATTPEHDGASSSTWSAAFARCDPTTLFGHAALHDPLLAPCLAAVACADRCNVEQAMQRAMPRSGMLSREVYVAESALDEDGNACVRTKTYVQEFSAQYLVDMMEGRAKSPAAIAAACEATLAAAAAATAANGNPPPAQEGKKKK